MFYYSFTGSKSLERDHHPSNVISRYFGKNTKKTLYFRGGFHA